MSDNEKLGKVLWWSKKDENGVIVDSDGNEFYFDRSVIELKKRQILDRGSLVIFRPDRTDTILAAKAVVMPVSKLKRKYEQKYEQSKVQLSLAF